MSEELKKEWEREFDEIFDDDWSGHLDMVNEEKLTGTVGGMVKSFISSLLAKQQMPTAMTNSEWIAYGKKMGYHDYWKDMTRIALQEEFVKCIPEEKEPVVVKRV